MMQFYWRGMKCHIKPLDKIPEDKREAMASFAFDESISFWRSEDYKDFWRKYLGL